MHSIVDMYIIQFSQAQECNNNINTCIQICPHLYVYVCICVYATNSKESQNSKAPQGCDSLVGLVPLSLLSGLPAQTLWSKSHVDVTLDFALHFHSAYVQQNEHEY